MRICLISREYPPDTGWGGIGAYTFQHAQGLKELGNDVEVIALAKESVLAEDEKTTFNENGIKVHRVIWGPLLQELSLTCFTMPYTHYLLRCVLPLWQKFLDVHTQNPFDVLEAPEHLAEAIFPAISKICPIVLRLHTPHSKFTAERYHNLSPTFDIQTVANFERLAMLEADLLSSPSIDLAKYVAQDTGVALDEILIVRNPVDSEKFCPDGPKAIQYSDSPIIFFAGRLEERKGIYDLIKAVPLVLEECPNVMFVVVGADTNTAFGARSVLTELKDSLLKTNSSSKVNFISHVSLDKMPDYYRSADICVVPSLYDNAPYTVLEAMSCGKPIVGCATGGIPEYVVNGQTGIVVPAADPKSLASALIALVKDKDKCIDYGRAARKRILESFERRHIAKEAVDSYKIAINRYSEKKNFPIYRRKNELFCNDFVSALYSYEQTLESLVYVHSKRFIKQRFKQAIVHRPKLVLAQILLKLVSLMNMIPLLNLLTKPLHEKLISLTNQKLNEIESIRRKKFYLHFGIDIDAN